MPLDTTTTYPTTLLRLDGRRWNDLRKFSASISTQPSADGSSLVSQGNTTIVCTVSGPREGRSTADRNAATIECEINVAPFAQLDRRTRGRTDKRVQELQTTIANAFQSHLYTHLYPRSSVLISLTVFSLDGGLLSACLNAASLALVDAGIPMPSILASISAGVILSLEGKQPEPVIDLNSAEETELPFLTLGTVRGETDREDQVSVMMMETRVQAGDGVGPLEVMMRMALDGCIGVRSTMEDVVREHGRQLIQARR